MASKFIFQIQWVQDRLMYVLRKTTVRDDDDVSISTFTPSQFTCLLQYRLFCVKTNIFTILDAHVRMLQFLTLKDIIYRWDVQKKEHTTSFMTQ